MLAIANSPSVPKGRPYSSSSASKVEAASLLVQRLKQEQAQQSVSGQAQAAPKHKPIWEVVDELRKNVPPEEFAKLPKDGAEQLDHYLYGSPKRPTA